MGTRQYELRYKVFMRYLDIPVTEHLETLGPFSPVSNRDGVQLLLLYGKGRPHFGSLLSCNPVRALVVIHQTVLLVFKTYLPTVIYPDLCDSFQGRFQQRMSRSQTIFLTITMQVVTFPLHLPLIICFKFCHLGK